MSDFKPNITRTRLIERITLALSSGIQGRDARQWLTNNGYTAVQTISSGGRHEIEAEREVSIIQGPPHHLPTDPPPPAAA